ncbi:hypothetical protein F8S13_01055 [Chloroflexia bacterium SDU3-3]|nr:hypothetical protein F8S13_01055 [Chloroflexia bacterium SDU3-3]
MEETLWVNTAGDRYFLIPNTITVQPGNYPILSLAQERRASVNAAALETFAIGEAEARARFIADNGPLFDETIRTLLASWETTIKPQLAGVPELLQQVLGILLGVAPQQLGQHPELAGQQSAELLRELAQVMSAASAPTKGERALARAQARALRKRLSDQGIDVDKRLEEIASDLVPREDLAKMLDQCAAALQRASVDSEDQLRELFDTLERDFGALVAPDPAEEERQRQQRLRGYRKSADDAIAAALRAQGLTPAADLPPTPTKRGRR